MSYTKQFHEKIAVHYSGSKSVSYPASQNGGSHTVYFDGTAYEDIYTNIEVDTNPFDRSVARCNTNVNMLTGAVVATEAAQIASINANAKKVGDTIVDGFFKTIRSEISQQIAELSSIMESHLLHLRSMAERCLEKKTQMKADYHRITDRYLKVFDDLNNELSNRIYELDKPVFAFKNLNDGQNIRTSQNDLVSTVAVFGAESGDLQARISASVAKKRALDTIGKANIFLLKQKLLNDTINQSMMKESLGVIRYSPVCFVETRSDNCQIGKNLYQSDFLPKMKSSELMSCFEGRSWGDFPHDNGVQIGRYFNAEVNTRYSSTDAHSVRVRDNIIKMFTSNKIKGI